MRSRKKINDAKFNTICHVFFICLFLESKRTVKRKNHGGTRHEKNIVRANRALTRCLFYSCVNSGVFSLNKTAVVARTWLIEGNLIVLDESSYEYFHLNRKINSGLHWKKIISRINRKDIIFIVISQIRNQIVHFLF